MSSSANIKLERNEEEGGDQAENTEEIDWLDNPTENGAGSEGPTMNPSRKRAQLVEETSGGYGHDRHHRKKVNTF
jgi:hypothetical protein